MSVGTVAICEECWREQMGTIEPVRFVTPETETCYACHASTLSGIYVRRHLNLPQPSSDQPMKGPPDE